MRRLRTVRQQMAAETPVWLVACLLLGSTLGGCTAVPYARGPGGAATNWSGAANQPVSLFENTGWRWWEGFRNPAVADPSLVMLEPYTPNRIPVVFIHGLLSDVATWEPAVRALQCDPWFRTHYQVWAFRYSTGGSYLGSAADLRTRMRNFTAALDPDGTNPALQNMVLVGHSMGGLLAKLQVAPPGGRLWSAVASRPVDAYAVEPAIRQRWDEMFFYTPLPGVTRIVYVATPHGGSELTTGRLARFARNLVQLPQAAVESFAQLAQDNGEALAADDRRRGPTSIDHLAPTSPVLQAVAALQTPPTVTTHTIIGTGRLMRDGQHGTGDRVVSVCAARTPGTVSEKLVRATHTQIQRDPETLCELRRILEEHLVAVGGTAGPVIPYRHGQAPPAGGMAALAL